MNLNQTHERRIATFALAMATFGTVAGQLHALARHATEDGKEDLELALTAVWAVPAAHWFRPLLSWSDPDTVYRTYGKLWLPVFVAFTLAAYVAYRRRRPVRVEKWVWRIALAAYALATVSVVAEYYTPYLDESFVFLSLPALLLTALSSTVLGGILLARGYRPRTSAVLLVAFIPSVVAITQVTSMGSAVLPLAWGWALAARRSTAAEETTRYRDGLPQALADEAR